MNGAIANELIIVACKSYVAINFRIPLNPRFSKRKNPCSPLWSASYDSHLWKRGRRRDSYVHMD